MDGPDAEIPPAGAHPHRELVTARLLPFARERVFAAFIDPDRLSRWWGPAGLADDDVPGAIDLEEAALVRIPDAVRSGHHEASAATGPGLECLGRGPGGRRPRAQGVRRERAGPRPGFWERLALR